MSQAVVRGSKRLGGESGGTSRAGQSIVHVERFVQATRDSGYRGLPAAISEFVDNSIEAGATDIRIEVIQGQGSTPEVLVLDNGRGMTPRELVRSLQFGGSNRFGNREGMGRYGMGLPNAALSLGCRVEVQSWRSSRRAHRTHLDVDEILTAHPEIVSATTCAVPTGVQNGNQGTLVHISKCDRLSTSALSRRIRELDRALGQRFRYFLWNGTKITVNKREVKPLDPLFLRGRTRRGHSFVFGDRLRYEIRVNPQDPSSPTGSVDVVFTEIPVDVYFGLSNPDKRRLGITGGAGVSIVRAGREVDYDWHFMGGKRKENYDDWWRAEIRFEPILDEWFGITHTKQQILPTEDLQAILSPDFESIAHALNGRVRAAHMRAKRRSSYRPAEEVATRAEQRLKPVSYSGSRSAARASAKQGEAVNLMYRIRETGSSGGYLYQVAAASRQLGLELNEHHPLARRLIAALNSSADQQLIGPLEVELILLAAARAEMSLGEKDRPSLERYRMAWSQVLAAFFDEVDV